MMSQAISSIWTTIEAECCCWSVDDCAFVLFRYKKCSRVGINAPLTCATATAPKAMLVVSDKPCVVPVVSNGSSACAMPWAAERSTSATSGDR